MPELPDVESYKRYLDATSLHQPIEAVHVGALRLLRDLTPQSLGRRLHGKALESTRRHGKYLFVRVEDGGWLVLHFGMSGRLRYAGSADALPRDGEMLLRFENGAGLAYLAPRKLGRIAWADDPADYVASQGLGADALELDEAGLRALAKGRRGGVKSWLMDQDSLAGIGNLYSDEILFQAGIHPRQAVAALDDAQFRTLARSLGQVLREAIEAQADPGAMPRSFLLPRREAGADCPRCGGRLDELRVAGRTAVFCPNCQPEAS